MATLLSVATVGGNIRRIRESQKINRRELGRRLGYEPGSSAVADLENDRSPNVGLDKLFKAAVALGVSIEEIVAGVHAPYDLVIRDLARQTPRVKSASPIKERADAADVEARLTEARKQNADMRATLATAAAALARAIADLDAVDGEDRADARPPTGTTGRRRGHRG